MLFLFFPLLFCFINTHMFEVMNLQNFGAAVSHSENLHVLIWIDLQQTLGLNSIQYGFVWMLVHLTTHKQQQQQEAFVCGCRDLANESRRALKSFCVCRFFKSATPRSTNSPTVTSAV